MSTKTVHERVTIPIQLVDEFAGRADRAVPMRLAAPSLAAIRAAFAQEVGPQARLRNY
jgi:hypothetical protein